MSARWSDPFAKDDDDEVFGWYGPRPGHALLRVDTPKGPARPRLASDATMWLDGEDWSLPLSRFDHGTLKAVYGPAPRAQEWSQDRGDLNTTPRMTASPASKGPAELLHFMADESRHSPGNFDSRSRRAGDFPQATPEQFRFASAPASKRLKQRHWEFPSEEVRKARRSTPISAEMGNFDGEPNTSASKAPEGSTVIREVVVRGQRPRPAAQKFIPLHPSDPKDKALADAINRAQSISQGTFKANVNGRNATVTKSPDGTVSIITAIPGLGDMTFAGKAQPNSDGSITLVRPRMTFGNKLIKATDPKILRIYTNSKGSLRIGFGRKTVATLGGVEVHAWVSHDKEGKAVDYSMH